MLLPLMQYLFDEDWPTPDNAVFMTAAKVWGPLGVSLLAWLVLSVWWVVLIGLAVTGAWLWVDPHPHASVEWVEYETRGGEWVRANG